MKRIMIALVCVLFVKAATAQQNLLSYDEHNKYIYYQVVDMPGLSADTLRARVIYFLKNAYPKFKIRSASNENAISGEGKFVTFGGVSVLKHETGEITYLLTVEFKDQRYRYWLTGFTFTPYQRDRYGNFVPQLGIDIPLETAASKIDKKELDNYLDETGAFVKQFGEKLKLYAIRATAPKKEEITKKVVTDKW